MTIISGAVSKIGVGIRAVPPRTIAVSRFIGLTHKEKDRPRVPVLFDDGKHSDLFNNPRSDKNQQLRFILAFIVRLKKMSEDRNTAQNRNTNLTFNL